MGVTLNTKKLTKEAISAISNGQLERGDIIRLRKNVVEYIEPVKKRFNLACALLATMFILMTASSLANFSKNGALDIPLLISMFAPIVLFLVVAFGFIGWLSFGRIKGQFNRALKKGLPDLYEEFKI